MLGDCAKGYQKRASDEIWVVTFKGKTATLPLGPHGNRKNPDIHWSHIRGLVDTFELDPKCVRKYFGPYKSRAEQRVEREQETPN